ncbi:ribonuclease P protein component 4 [Methanonatronarchaeum sp. AMET6-2]|uniref:ribonuclease P protein component 4 n=1 Tax=Methanonatronarchaeum sp. AMET6-2 TaxID=2933293 RepID=UPI0012005020|nr:hypothetical protein [Methanonatronarchaeum sp. AMET6-2]RZN61743.1 MAG: ribonuclease P [Methanonatronarchaeia archaeon]UOY10099.1 hypothetical protein MU439_00195 [Methanonatronarchaeum sp. AMET6-2]
MNQKNKKDLAKQRIEKLFKQAQKKYSENPELSHRYMEIAWKLKLKTRVEIPKPYRNRVCRKCQSYLVPGDNQKTRIHNSKIIHRCLECGNIKRIPLNNQKQ